MRAREFLLEFQLTPGTVSELRKVLNIMPDDHPIRAQIDAVLAKIGEQLSSTVPASPVAPVQPMQEDIYPAEDAVISQLEQDPSLLTRVAPADANALKKLIAQARAEGFAAGLKKGGKTGYKGGVQQGAQQTIEKIAATQEKLLRYAKSMLKRFDPALANDEQYVSSFLNIFTSKNLDTGMILEFMEAAISKKVLKLEDAVKNTSGTLSTYVDPTYKTVFDAVWPGLSQLKTGASRGSVGPGEIAMVVLGPATKSAKGDVKIGKHVYEIKASQITGKNRSQSGGRLTSDTMPKLKPLQGKVAELIKKYFGIKQKDLYTRDKKGAPAINWSISLKGMKQFNSWPGDYDTKVKFLREFMNLIMPGSAKNKEMLEITKSMLNPKTGEAEISLDGAFMRGFLKANFVDYASTGHFDRLMFLNTDSKGYHIIDHNDDIDNMIMMSNARIMSGMTLNDGQNPGAVQVYSF